MIGWILGRLGSYLWPVVGAAFVALTLAVGVQTKRVTWAKAETQQVKNAWTLAQADATAAALAQTAQFRATEQAWQDKQKEINDDAEKRLAQVRADATLADASAGRLSVRVTALVAQARTAAANPPAVGASAPASDPIGMLAELQRRADEAAGIYARIADERGAAGSTCEREYDAVSATAK